ncbi:hypothetical protein Tco_0038855 [Tanacetum coccineum]
MDWLSKRKFVIVCHEKVVRIPLEGDEILRVHGKRTQGVVKTLMNTKRQVEFRIDLVDEAMPVAKSPCRLAPSEMQELSEQLQELKDKGFHLTSHFLWGGATVLSSSTVCMRMPFQRPHFERERHFKSTAKPFGLTNAQQFSWNLMNRLKSRNRSSFEVSVGVMRKESLGDALCRKERVKSRRVRGMILAAQSEAFKQENVLTERLHGSVMDEAHASRYLVYPGVDKTYYNLRDVYCLRYLRENEIESPWILSLNFQDAAESVRDAMGFEYCLASSSGWTKSPVLWAEIGESSLIGPELVQETTDKVFEVGDQVMLKVSPCKGVVGFGKKGKLAPMYVEPFEILERIGSIAYRCLNAFMWIMWEIGSQSIKCDHLNEIEMVVRLVKFISFTFGDKEMIFVV